MQRKMIYGVVSVQVLYKFLRHNAIFINFWLEACVYEREAKYFPQSLKQTAWHLADTVSGKVCSSDGPHAIAASLRSSINNVHIPGHCMAKQPTTPSHSNDRPPLVA